MRILLNDIIQYSDVSETLKSPALSDLTFIENGELIINLDKPRELSSVGIGNTDGTYFNINNEELIDFTNNGLYVFKKKMTTDILTISTDATYIGRIGAGIACVIPTSVAKEPGLNSTAEPRITLSGQVVPGIGGHNYKTLFLDSRYKINEIILKELQVGYKFISQGYPFFIDLSVESYKLPFNKLYANDRNQQQLRFDSGVRKYLYSRRWEFEERF